MKKLGIMAKGALRAIVALRGRWSCGGGMLGRSLGIMAKCIYGSRRGRVNLLAILRGLGLLLWKAILLPCLSSRRHPIKGIFCSSGNLSRKEIRSTVGGCFGKSIICMLLGRWNPNRWFSHLEIVLIKPSWRSTKWTT